MKKETMLSFALKLRHVIRKGKSMFVCAKRVRRAAWGVRGFMYVDTPTPCIVKI